MLEDNERLEVLWKKKENFAQNASFCKTSFREKYAQGKRNISHPFVLLVYTSDHHSLTQYWLRFETMITDVLDE